MSNFACGLGGGVKDGIHTISHKMQQHILEERWGFLMVDVQNIFNEGNHIRSLLTVCLLWLSGARLCFSCYRHWVILVVQNGSVGGVVILFSREGVT